MLCTLYQALRREFVSPHNVQGVRGVFVFGQVATATSLVAGDNARANRGRRQTIYIVRGARPQLPVKSHFVWQQLAR